MSTNEQAGAAPQMDWEQVRLNGGPPCYALLGETMPDGVTPRYCGRAQRWSGHPADHAFVAFAAPRSASTLNAEAPMPFCPPHLNLVLNRPDEYAVGCIQCERNGLREERDRLAELVEKIEVDTADFPAGNWVTTALKARSRLRRIREHIAAYKAGK